MVKIQGNLLPSEKTESDAWQNLPHFLKEHADYERKASDYALSIIGKYPDKTAAIVPLAQIAVDSLTIFKNLCELMLGMQVDLIPESPQSLYLKQLNWLNRSGREDRFIDRLLLGHIAENRCAVRFKAVSLLMEEMSLAAFYNACSKLKEEHADTYLELGYKAASDDAVNTRLDYLKVEEEKIMTSLGLAAGIF